MIGPTRKGRVMTNEHANERPVGASRTGLSMTCVMTPEGLRIQWQRDQPELLALPPVQLEADLKPGAIAA
jgi:hypothetical protein